MPKHPVDLRTNDGLDIYVADAGRHRFTSYAAGN
ncbi:hypothetical protein [Mycobacterium sp. MS1601]